jgi:hypothetical protein
METQPGETETKQGETSANEQSTSIESTPEFQKALSDHLAKAGREAKSLAEREAAISKREQATAEREAAQAQAKAQAELRELDEALNDPDATEGERQKIVRAKDFLKKTIAEARAEAERLNALKKEISDNNELVKEIQSAKFQKSVREIAAELKVDPDDLLSTVTSEKVENLDTVKLIAKAKPKITVTPPKVDSGKSIGGSNLNYDDITRMSPAEYQKNRDAIYQRLLAKQKTRS